MRWRVSGGRSISSNMSDDDDGLWAEREVRGSVDVKDEDKCEGEKRIDTENEK